MVGSMSSVWTVYIFGTLREARLLTSQLGSSRVSVLSNRGWKMPGSWSLSSGWYSFISSIVYWSKLLFCPADSRERQFLVKDRSDKSFKVIFNLHLLQTSVKLTQNFIPGSKIIVVLSLMGYCRFTWTSITGQGNTKKGWYEAPRNFRDSTSYSIRHQYKLFFIIGIKQQVGESTLLTTGQGAWRIQSNFV